MKIKLIEHFTWPGNRLTEGVTSGQGICLLLLGPWSHLWYIQGLEFAIFSDLYFLQDFVRSTTVRNVCHYIQVNWVSKYCEINVLKSKQLCHLLWQERFLNVIRCGRKSSCDTKHCVFCKDLFIHVQRFAATVRGSVVQTQRRFVRRLWIDGNINAGCVCYCTIENKFYSIKNLLQYSCCTVHVNCSIITLFTVLRPTQEFFTYMETSPLPLKGCKI
jgi:hypothetical protein